MWTQDDKADLRRLRIQSDAPPPPLPRFRVEPARLKGYYRVLDANRRFAVKIEIGPPISDPRAACEELAAQLNTQYGRPVATNQVDDGA